MAAVLSFIGLKMLGAHYLPISREVSMVVVLSLLVISVVVSLVFQKRDGGPLK